MRQPWVGLLMLLQVMLLAATVGSIAAAGPNAGGTVLVTWNLAVPYAKDPQFIKGGLMDCMSAIVQAPPAETFPPPDDQKRLWFAYAAFPSGSLPRLKGISFGVKFPPFNVSTGVNVLWAALEPEIIDFPTQGWPTRPNSGIVLVFPDTRTGLVEQLCVFAGYGSEGTRFALGVHPAIASQFADDVVPPNLDDITDFGSMGFGIEGRCPCPGPAFGACCIGDGRCLVLSPVECAAQGDYRGNGVQCEPNPCHQPVAACCYGNGECVMARASECAELDGWWTGEASCVVELCSTENRRGACCTADGSCRYVWEAQCETGDWRAEVPCVPNPCTEDQGACCNLETAECSIQTSSDCEAADYPHRWMGASTACEPNPCPSPQIYGACCSGSTCSYLTQEECQSFDWRPNEPCSPNPCLDVRGACCFPDHHCEILYARDCPSGIWLGNRSCEEAACSQYEFGACCDTESEICFIVTQANCYRFGSTHWWAGGGSSCDPNPCVPPPVGGACCPWSGGQCLWAPQDHCNGLWMPGRPCEPDPCPQPGACCYDAGCVVVIEDLCPTGRWHFGVSCEPDPCPPDAGGACCYSDGRCEHVDEPHQCSGGAWHFGVPCEPNPCPQPPPAGACCHLVTGLCSVLSEAECASLQYPHTWDSSVMTCDPNPCLDLVGACCLPHGWCILGTLGECEGTWVFGSECSPDVCMASAPGACCYPNGGCYHVPETICGGFWTDLPACNPNPCPGAPPDGACCNLETGVCTLMPAFQCGEQSYSHLWLDGGCDPNPCTPPPVGGACCSPDGECRIVLQEQCQPPDRWDGSECQPNPCEPVPTERTSWGQIKARFR